MRISPLGVFGASGSPADVWEWACADASLTHPHPVCVHCTAVLASAVAFAIRSGEGPEAAYLYALSVVEQHHVDPKVFEFLKAAQELPPADYLHLQGWVLIAFQNAFYQLLHAESLESGVVNTVRAGGDTDTNAAIAGALLRAVHAVDAIPQQWARSVLNCRPQNGGSHVRKPRPERYWPVDVFSLAEELLAGDRRLAGHPPPS